MPDPALADPPKYVDLARLYPTSPAPTPAPGPPGPAYFAVEKIGVVRLDDDGSTILPGSPTRGLANLQIGGDRALWVRDKHAIHRFDGAAFRQVAPARIAARID